MMHRYHLAFRQAIRSVILAVALFLSGFTARGTHIVGADFYYEYISGNNYKVSVAIYGDCSGASFPNLAGAAPQIDLINGSSSATTASFNLASDGPGVEVTPVCESQKNNTTCHNGTIPGVTRYIYSSTVTLPFASADWHFRFTGTMGNNSLAGRSAIITNLQTGAGASVLQMDITLNNLNGPNSSPRFTTIPTPFYCINVAQQYNPGAVDPNNDSLVYALAPAISTGGTPVPYEPGFSATNPLSVVANTFSFNTITGQLNFKPDNTQVSTVVTRVTEYRNGVEVGSAVREMNFIVLANCANNNPPSSTLDTAASPIITTTGGVMADPTTFNVCEGTPNIAFLIHPVDPEGDTITALVNGLPAGMTATTVNNNTPSPRVAVHWNGIGALAPGYYTFFVTFKDNGCPFSSQQTQAYTVRIIRPNSITYRTLYPTQCFHKAYVEYQLANGLLPRTVIVKQGAVIIRSFVDSTGTYRDSLSPGTYSVVITSPKLPCQSTIALVVSDSGRFPFPPVLADQFYCLNNTGIALSATTYTGATISYWMDSLFNHFTTPPVPNTSVAGIFKWYAVQRYKVCESLPDTGLVYVTKVPIAAFNIAPSTICDRDTVDVTFTGAIGVGPILEYLWDWNNAGYVHGPAGGPYRVHWQLPGTKTITLQVLENKCPSDTVSQQYVVKPTPLAAFTATNICLQDTLHLTYDATVLTGQSFTWSFDGADLPSANAAGPYNLHWSTQGTKHISLTVSKDGCTDTSSKYVEVYPMPVAQILNVPGVNCLGDKIYLEHAGTGDYYVWMPRNQVYFEPKDDGRPYTFTLQPTTYTLIVSNAEGCVDSAHVTYDRIEPCCNFSYPTAFTPNNDGHNDRFRVVTYGNDANFSLSIFDRWGQLVYHSGNPKEGWDGKLNGKDCDMGTYYYNFKAKCLTGHEETAKGAFTLIR